MARSPTGYRIADAPPGCSEVDIRRHGISGPQGETPGGWLGAALAVVARVRAAGMSGWGCKLGVDAKLGCQIEG